MITNHFVLFHGVPTLQAQNEKLLGYSRLGAKMECAYRETLEKEQGEAVREEYEATAALFNLFDA